MASTSLCYRGLRYDHSADLPPSADPIEHVYRGRHYAAPLLHHPLIQAQTNDLIYRGTHHHPQHLPLSR